MFFDKHRHPFSIAMEATRSKRKKNVISKDCNPTVTPSKKSPGGDWAPGDPQTSSQMQQESMHYSQNIISEERRNSKLRRRKLFIERSSPSNAGQLPSNTNIDCLSLTMTDQEIALIDSLLGAPSTFGRHEQVVYDDASSTSIENMGRISNCQKLDSREKAYGQPSFAFLDSTTPLTNSPSTLESRNYGLSETAHDCMLFRTSRMDACDLLLCP